MNYIERKKLTVIKVNNDMDMISVDILAEIMLDRPSNIIYCECEERLYGIISMGDIARAFDRKWNQVPINRHYSCVLEGDYVKARKFFNENKNINGLPVVNKVGTLGGGYIRWDDLITIQFMIDCNRTVPYENCSVALVYPCSIFKIRQRVFHYFYQYLVERGIDVKCIKNTEIPEYIDNVDWICFVDEEELRGIDTFYTYLSGIKCRREKFITYMTFIKQTSYEILNSYLRKLSENGICVVNLVYHVNSAWDQMVEKISDKFRMVKIKASGKMPVEMYVDFFDDLYTEEYAEQIMQLEYSVESKSGTGMLKDCHSRYYNVTNGERYTYGQPNLPDKNLFFFGPCFIYGHYTEDRYTIESFLQERLNELLFSVKVFNFGSQYSDQISIELARIMATPLCRGDIVVLYSDNMNMKWVRNLDLTNVLVTKDIKPEWVVDDLRHCNHKVNSFYADTIFHALEPVLSQKVAGQGERIVLKEDFVKIIYINRYFTGFRFSEYNKIGSIVMNCNPFTYGHRYLIEKALEQVDFLIIFVVEEDKSVFSFVERFAMVCKGVADLKNVKVVPSGPFILSRMSFPEYFIKESDEDIVENVENDITFFAERIAPYLNIDYRFVGEEPNDMVTNEYNLAMKKILPKYGISLIEIPRKKWDNKYISASLVRKYLENGDNVNLKKLVPKSTINIIFDVDE